MIILTQNYFVYGFMILYLLYALAFVYQISRNRFPLEGDIILKTAKLERLISRKKTKAMDKAKCLVFIQQAFRNPELLLTLLSIMYFVLMLVLSVTKIEGVNMKKGVYHERNNITFKTRL